MSHSESWMSAGEAGPAAERSNRIQSLAHASISRRRLLAGMGGAAVGLVAPRTLFAAGTRGAQPGTQPARRAAGLAGVPHHLAWVWQFQHDGDPVEVRDTLAHFGLGVVLKTHDGVEWMSTYDETPTAVSGPKRIQEYADFFEQAGVPFHAWAVVKGIDPLKEASMASDVLNAGARSLFLDLEAHDGFWLGDDDDAARYGEALRLYQPRARLATTIDPRPWEIDRIPLKAFADFTDEIAPQVYWSIFSNEANARKYVADGIDVVADDIGPKFILDSAMARLADYGLPIHPIGDGTVHSLDAWNEFIDESYLALADTVSVWRYGVVERDLWALLQDTPPRVTTYVVAAGDSLGAIAARFGTTASVIAEMNGIANINLIHPGQVLRLPGGGQAPPSSGGSAPSGGGSPSAQPVASTPSGGTRHTVMAGDTLLGIALAYGSTLSQVAAANRLSPPYLIRVGDVIVIP